MARVISPQCLGGPVARLDVASVKKDFPVLERRVNGHRLVYLDSASSSQKPAPVLDAMEALAPRS